MENSSGVFFHFDSSLFWWITHLDWSSVFIAYWFWWKTHQSWSFSLIPTCSGGTLALISLARIQTLSCIPTNSPFCFPSRASRTSGTSPRWLPLCRPEQIVTMAMMGDSPAAAACRCRRMRRDRGHDEALSPCSPTMGKEIQVADPGALT